MASISDYCIIVAGGKGLRMGGDVPKQFLPVNGLPVLMRTLQRFHEYDTHLQLILVLPREQQDYWLQLCLQYHFPLPSSGGAGEATLPSFGGAGGGPLPSFGGAGGGPLSYLLADGGQTRFHSVQNGLALVPDDARGEVGVHDGVRPFVSVDVIRSCYEEARRTKAVIPVVPVVETLRHVSGRNVLRSDYRLVQTPQVFDIQLLKAANRQPYQESFTDDASVVEAYGHQVTMVEGNRENIKITTPFDLKIAEVLTR